MSRKLVCMLGVVLFCTTALVAAPEKAVVEKKAQEIGVDTGPAVGIRAHKLDSATLTQRTDRQVVTGDRDITTWTWDNDDGFYGGWMMFHAYNPPYDILLADDFVPCDDVSINSVQWFSGYWASSTEPAITSVRILFFADDPADPGHPTGGGTASPETTAIYNQLIPWGSVNVTPGPYSQSWDCQVDLTTPFVASEGQRYWLVVQPTGTWAMPPYLGWISAALVKEEISKEHGWEADNEWWDQLIDTNYDLAWSLAGNIVAPAVCGNNVAEGCEECDGTDNALCGAGACIDPGEPDECTCTYVPCALTCPAGAIDGETEPCDDSTQVNAGCNMDPPDADSAEDTLQCGVTVCGHSWLTDTGVDYDQYAVVLPTDQIMTVTYQAEFPAFCGFLIYNEGDEGSGDCNDLGGTWYTHPVPKCTVQTFSNVNTGNSDECVPAGTYFLMMAVNWDSEDNFPCSSAYEENLYYMTLDCEPCTIIACPEDSLFSQPARGGDSDYWYASGSDEYYTLTWYENFYDVLGDVCDIHFWGLLRDYEGTGYDCTQDPTTFEIKFFQPDAVTQIGTTYTVAISPVDTFHVYDPDGTPGNEDDATLWEFSADLVPCVDLHGMDGSNNPTADGWVSIRALGTDTCVFSWAAYDVCGPDAFSIVWDSDTEAFYYDFVDWSLCLTGEEEEFVLGACCYEPTGDCTQTLYTGCDPGDRFEPYTDCPGDTTFGVEIDPPCGVIEGACCDPATGLCSYTTADECATAGGNFVANGTCYPNTCPQPDPCDGPTVIYEQTPYDDNPETIPFSFRNYGNEGIITAADVNLPSGATISDLHWWGTNEVCFQWSGSDDVLIFNDVAGEPGTVDIINPGPYPDDNPYYDIPNFLAFYNGETFWNGEREVVIYTIILGDADYGTEEFPPIVLAPGIYWIGMRPVGMLYDWSAMMVTAAPIGEGYRQKWDDDPTWTTPEGDEPDIAFCLTYSGPSCPTELTFVANPPSGAIDARKPHLNSSTIPCYGFGMPDDPSTATKDESTYYPIVIDLGVVGAGDMSCWSYCETPDMSASDCGSNSISSITDNLNGTYTIMLNHGIQGGTVATIQYNGGSYAEYFHHPANADGSGASNANDIVTVVDCLNMPGSCENYEADIDASGAQAPNDIIEEIDLLNGAGAYEPWFNTVLPVNDDCP